MRYSFAAVWQNCCSCLFMKNVLITFFAWFYCSCTSLWMFYHRYIHIHVNWVSSLLKLVYFLLFPFLYTFTPSCYLWLYLCTVYKLTLLRLSLVSTLYLYSILFFLSKLCVWFFLLTLLHIFLRFLLLHWCPVLLLLHTKDFVYLMFCHTNQ